MIPLREQEALRQRFARDLNGRVRIDCFTQKPSPLFVSGRQECLYCDDTRALVEELAALSNRIALTVHDFVTEPQTAADLGVDKVPAVVIRGQANRPLRFFGLPSGGLFSAMIEAIVEATNGGPLLSPEALKQVRRLKSDVRLQVFAAPGDRTGSPFLLSAALLGLQSPRIKVDVIETGEFIPLAERHGIRAVPTTIVGESLVLKRAVDGAVLLQSIRDVAERKPLPAVAPSGPATPVSFDSQQAQQPQVRSVGPSGLVIPR